MSRGAVENENRQRATLAEGVPGKIGREAQKSQIFAPGTGQSLIWQDHKGLS